jgi:serralysin
MQTLKGDEPMATIAAIAAGDARFNVLVAALQFVDNALPGTNLLGALSDAHANLTVFAPTDAAFGQLASDLGFTGEKTDEAAVTTFLTENLTAETIRDVITYHVSAGAKTLAQIVANPTVDTLNGATITADGVTLVDQEPDLINPSLVQTDVHATNGIVHVIDRVLLPIDLPGNDVPTITGLVAASGDFDNNGNDFDLLLRAVQAADLAGALDDANADLTVFAPNDAAFMKLAATLGFEGGGEAAAFDYVVDALTLLSGGDSPIPLLKNILLYHVAPESLQASQVLATDSIETLLGTDLGRNGTRLVDADPQITNPKLIATDIQTSNGVVHVIDGVLLPVNILPTNGANNVKFVIGDNGPEILITGADRDFVDGNGGSDLIRTGAGRDVALGGTGSDVMFGGAGADSLRGDEAADFIFGGKGNDTVAGGSGSDYLSGGRGTDVFEFGTSGGNDRVIDFRNGADKIDLSDLGIEAFADLAGKIKTSLGAATIDLGDDGRIFLAGIRTAQLDATDFIFA